MAFQRFRAAKTADEERCLLAEAIAKRPLEIKHIVKI
jgi:hypothetical protein